MQCPKCGHENPAHARFCGKCGATVAVSEVSGSSPPAIPATAQVSDVLKWGITIGSLLLPLLGFIMGGIYVCNASPAKKDAGKIWLIAAVAGCVFYFAVNA